MLKPLLRGRPLLKSAGNPFTRLLRQQTALAVMAGTFIIGGRLADIHTSVACKTKELWPLMVHKDCVDKCGAGDRQPVPQISGQSFVVGASGGDESSRHGGGESTGQVLSCKLI